MKKIELGIVYGGMSTEHEVSVKSAMSVLENINKDKYNVHIIYISEEGEWGEYIKNEKESLDEKITVKLFRLHKIENIVEYLRNLDVVFPILHGLYGEDGTIQGMLELLGIKYVGCKVLASSVGMDKIYTKIILDKAGIKQAKYCYIKHNNGTYIYVDDKFEEQNLELSRISKIVEEKLNLPVFVKPSNSGSSVGVRKANTLKEVKEAIEHAALFDNKILIEECINGKEIECAVLGNEEVKASRTGQIISAEEFYSFDAKYKNAESKLIIPSGVECENEIKKLAIRAFKAIDGSGLARVDFFVTNNNEIYINEINTMPGFTSISMYPKLWAESGIEYSELIDELIKLALE